MFTLLLIVSLLAPNPQVTWFGVGLGERLSIPKCTEISAEMERACYRMPETSDNSGNWIEIFGMDLPREFANVPAKGVVIEGRLEAIFLETLGVEVQGAVLGLMTAQIGRPHEEKRVAGAFADGIETDVIVASWQLRQSLVEFIGGFGAVDSGFLWVATPRGHELSKDELWIAKRR